MNRARNQVFSRAGFAEDQDRYVGGRYGFNLPEDAPQHGTIAEDVLKSVFRMKLLFEIALLLLFSFQGLLGFHLFGKVADYAKYDTARGGFGRAEHEVNREFGAVLAAAPEFESDAHGPRLGVSAVFFTMFGMNGTKSFGDQCLNRLANEFLAAVAEELFHL